MSKNPAFGFCAVPAESSPHPHTIFGQMSFHINILICMIRPPKSHSHIPNKILYAIPILPVRVICSPISSLLTGSCWCVLVQSACYEASAYAYAFFPHFLSLRSIYSYQRFVHRHYTCAVPTRRETKFHSQNKEL